MVTEFGMTDAIGPQQLGNRQGEPFLGRETSAGRDHSDEVAARVDHEVRTLIDNAHVEAREVLTLHRVTLDRLADALVEKETLDSTELAVLFDGLPTWSGVTLNGSGDGNGARASGGAVGSQPWPANS
jgi:cell division protease FtsH